YKVQSFPGSCSPTVRISISGSSYAQKQNMDSSSPHHSGAGSVHAPGADAIGARFSGPCVASASTVFQTQLRYQKTPPPTDAPQPDASELKRGLEVKACRLEPVNANCKRKPGATNPRPHRQRRPARFS